MRSGDKNKKISWTGQRTFPNWGRFGSRAGCSDCCEKVAWMVRGNLAKNVVESLCERDTTEQERKKHIYVYIYIYIIDVLLTCTGLGQLLIGH